MKVLVTGSSGFIGKNLINFLKVNSNDIIIYSVDRNNGFDLSKPGWTKKLKFDDIDVVIHLAQSRNYRDFESYANEIFLINVTATQEILNWSKLNNVKRFIFSSTFNVYDYLDQDIKDESSLVNPNTYYGLTKSLAENLIFHYSDYFETQILRLNTVYGIGQKNMLIPNLINKILNNKEIYISKNKGLIISPINIEDLNRIFLRFILSRTLSKNNIINVSSHEVIDINDIVRVIETNLNIKSKVKSTESLLLNYSSNPSKLLSFLGEPFDFIPFREGIKKLCNEI